MLRLLAPQTIDNTFRGQWLGFWLMAPLLIAKLGIAIMSIVNPAEANRADAIDVSTYSEAALRAGLTTTALLGLLHLSIALLGVLAMIRYHAMVPLIYLMLFGEFVARRFVLAAYPIERSEGVSSGSIVNIVLVTLMVLGLAFSLWTRRNAPP